MREIVAGLFQTLDGVVESPEKWQFAYFNDEMGREIGAQTAAADTMLLGRRTYQEFAAYWPHQLSEAPFAEAAQPQGHDWASATLTPYSLRAGAAPVRPGQVVLDAALARRSVVAVGDRIRIAVRGMTGTYRVTGVVTPAGDRAVTQPALFFSASDARRLAGHPSTVDTIGVLAVIGIVLGTAVSTSALVPFSVAASNSLMPSGPPWIYLAVVGTAAALALAATLLPTWQALRSPPAEAAAAPE